MDDEWSKDIITSVDTKALRDRSNDLSRVNPVREVPSNEIFSWYVPGKERDLTSSKKIVGMRKIVLV